MKKMKYSIYRKIAVLMAWTLLIQISFPTMSYALTSGPSQPEVQSFEPVGTSEMVDLFSGDFNYNIPLLEVGGYPLNLAYHAGVGLEDEASWVGLGWNLNPGSMSRNMRGIPDDFAGEVIKKDVHIKPTFSVDLSAELDPELFGFGKSLGFGFGISYNNYKGFSLFKTASIGNSVGIGSYDLNYGLSINDNNGLSISPNLSLNSRLDILKKKSTSAGLSIGTTLNSRKGMEGVSFRPSINRKYVKTSFNDDGTHGYDLSYSKQSVSSSAIVSFNEPTYTTSSSYNSQSYSFDFKLGVGVSPFLGILAKSDILGSYSRYSIDGDVDLIGYGNLYQQHAIPGKHLLDFNREKDGSYYKKTKHLALTNMTNDIFHATGQGAGGAFKVNHNNVGYVADPIVLNDSDGASAGYEFGVPGGLISFEGGINIGFTDLDGYSGPWNSGNGSLEISNFKNTPQTENEDSKALFESAYFKQVNEGVINTRYSNLEKSEPLRLRMLGGNGELTGEYKDKNHGDAEVQNTFAERAVRNTLFQHKDVKEANRFALDKISKSYKYPAAIRTYNGINTGQLDYNALPIDERVNLVDDGIKETQIYETSILNANGMRYVYGLPVYNVVKKDVVFNIDSKAIPNGPSDIEVNYHETDILENDNGLDHFSSVDEMPAYAHSYLLTAVLSADYVDVDDNGPSDNDLGSWTKFNYTCHAGSQSDKDNYKWRFPFVKDLEDFVVGGVNLGKLGKANFDEGFKSQQFDDKGNYSYGEKELWYLHSVESKSHIAIFEVSDRKDGIGVLNEKGESDLINNPVPQQKLDKIKYYAKRQYLNDLATMDAVPTPLKTVHFDYDYHLCPLTPNSKATLVDDGGTGKLTLKSIYFTYGSSTKGQHSKYAFEYSDINPTYDRRSIDRWGNYKEEPSNVNYNPLEIASDDVLSNSDYPYSEQNEDLADNYASAWNLNRIHLPSGGIINIEYEADDYAYVQDQVAGEMFKLLGTAKEEPSKLSEVFSGSTAPLHDGDFYNYLVVDLNKSDQVVSLEDFKDKYLKDISKLYFRCLVDLHSNNHEFVSGFTKVSPEKVGVFNEMVDGELKNYAWIKLEGQNYDEIKPDNDNVNPIAKTAWQYARLNIPQIVDVGMDVDEQSGFERMIRSLFEPLIYGVGVYLQGRNRSLKTRGFANKIIPSKSWVRLHTPELSKKGGGHRVKSIYLNDNWEAITNNTTNVPNGKYGQRYFYKDYDGEELISSGVASYEPSIGADENILRVPGPETKEEIFMAPDNHHYVLEPLGESFYPGASVGYSKVLVADLRFDKNVERTATGYSINEFYTTKDFPYQTQVNLGAPYDDNSGFFQSFLTGRNSKKLHVTQGYTVEINDMHGRQKRSSTCGGVIPFDETINELYIDVNTLDVNQEISSVQYVYNTKDGKLDNTVSVMNDDGSVDEGTIGLDISMVNDFRTHSTVSKSRDIDINLDGWAFLLGGVLVGTSWVPTTTQESILKAAVTTKCVTRSGILDSVIVNQDGAIVTTENLVYDSQTGGVLLTSVNTEYNDGTEVDENKLFNMTYPAHWAYTGMSNAFENIGVEGKLYADGSGGCFILNEQSSFGPFVNVENVFHKGDVLTASGLEVNQGGFMWVKSPFKLWVKEINKNTNRVVCIDKNGVEFNEGTVDFKIIRSGQRNQQSAPIASLTSLKNPIEVIKDGAVEPLTDDEFDQANKLQVINFSAQEFSDDWKAQCREGTFSYDETCEYELNLYHPTSSTLNELSFTQVDNSTTGGLLFDKRVTQQCEEELSIYEENNSEIEYLTLKSSVKIKNLISYFNNYSGSEKFYLDFIKVHIHNLDAGNNDVIEEMIINLAPIGVGSLFEVPQDVLDGTCSGCVPIVEDDLFALTQSSVSDLSNTNEFELAIKNVISNTLLLSTHALDSDAYNIEVRFFRNGPTNFYNSLYIDTDCRTNTIGKWVGIDKTDLDLQYYNPSTGQTNFIAHEFDYDNIEVEGNSPCGTLTRKNRMSHYMPYVLNSSNFYNVDINNPVILSEINVGEIQSRTCTETITEPCYDTTVEPNPYLTGAKGNYRVSNSYVHKHVPRVNNGDNDGAQLATQGYYETFDQFWRNPSSTEEHWTMHPDNYISTEKVTLYSPYGQAIESQDALGNYSAAVLGYDQQLVIAAGSNTQYQNLGFDGFEEYVYQEAITECKVKMHTDFGLGGAHPSITTDMSHTGLYSFKIPFGESFNGQILNDCIDSNCSDCIPRFSLKYHHDNQAKNKYVLDMWVYVGDEVPTISMEADFGNGNLVNIPSGSQTAIEPKGPVIDGWQRVYYIFSLQDLGLTSDVNSIRLDLDIISNETSKDIYIDDIRLYPFDANMTSFVYYPGSLKLMAELDENNHATFYEYDEEWNLVRVKKETERGIMTLQENRSNTRIVND